MRKMTLLEMTQNILSALDSDEVNSISDTIESLQVAEVIKETYYEQFNNIFVPEHHGLIKLQDHNNLSQPNVLRIPSNVSKLEWIKYRDYRSSGQFRTIPYINPDLFLERVLLNTSGFSTFFTTDPEQVVNYYVRNDGPPSCYTMFDDSHLVFDSFDKTYEDNLVSSNSLAFGWKPREFELRDDYVPFLDANLFPLLLAEAKSTCFINLKQISSSKEEQRARRQRIRMQNDQFRSRQAQLEYWNRGPNFSRRR